MAHIITVTTTNASDCSVNTGRSSNAVLDSDDSCIAHRKPLVKHGKKQGHVSSWRKRTLQYVPSNDPEAIEMDLTKTSTRTIDVPIPLMVDKPIYDHGTSCSKSCASWQSFGRMGSCLSSDILQYVPKDHDGYCGTGSSRKSYSSSSFPFSSEKNTKFPERETNNMPMKSGCGVSSDLWKSREKYDASASALESRCDVSVATSSRQLMGRKKQQLPPLPPSAPPGRWKTSPLWRSSSKNLVTMPKELQSSTQEKEEQSPVDPETVSTGNAQHSSNESLNVTSSSASVIRMSHEGEMLSISEQAAAKLSMGNCSWI